MTPEDVLRLLVDAINKDGGLYIDHLEDEGAVEIAPCFHAGMTDLGEAYVQACILLDAPIVACRPYRLGRDVMPQEEALELCKLPRRR